MSSRGTTFFKRGSIAGILAGALLVPSLMGIGASSATPSRSELASAKARLEQLHNDFEIAVEKYNTVRSRLQDIRSRINTTELQISDLRRSIDSHTAKAVKVARQMYEGGPSGALEMVLSSKSLGQIESTLQYLRSTESTQAKVFERLAVDRRQMAIKLDQLDKARAAATRDERAAAELKDQIQKKLASQQDEVDRLEAEIAAARRRAAARRAAARRAAARRAAAAAAQPDPAPAPPSSPSSPSSSSSSSPSSSPSSSAAAAPAPVSHVSASAGASTAVSTAVAQVGKPYQWGAAGPDAFDCSGLTMYAWGAAGVSLPHSSSAQYSVTQHVSSSSMQPGDLLFYYSPIHHVAMYIGGGRMVEAPYTGSSVRVTSLRTSDLVGVGRP